MLARENPFRVERMHALGYRFGGGDSMAAFRARIDARAGRGAVVGPRGSGKSTLLCELAELLKAEGRRVRCLRIGAGRHTLTPPERDGLLIGLSDEDAVLLDGAGHLWPHQWWAIRRALKPAGSLVITTHREGRLPTALRTSTSLSLMRDLLGELGASLPDADLRALFGAHRGDARAIFRELYERGAATAP